MHLRRIITDICHTFLEKSMSTQPNNFAFLTNFGKKNHRPIRNHSMCTTPTFQS